jgi:hypothetical protein
MIAERCPNCGRPSGGLRHGQQFGGTAVRIIDAVERAGVSGILIDDLFELVYRNRPAQRSALKAYINNINDKLREDGWVIRAGRTTRYRMIKRGL